MKMKRIISLLYSLVLVVALVVPSFATELPRPLSNEIINSLNFELDLSEYPEFNLDDYKEYLQLFEEYNINVNDIIAVVPENKIFSGQIAPRGNIPGGIVVLTGQFLSPYVWKLTVTNAGLLRVDSLEADVKLWNDTMGPVLNSIRYLGGLGLYGSVSETYTQNYFILEAAVVTVTGQTSQGEWFSLGGIDVR